MEHSFDVDIAKEYGVNAAIILKNIYFWVEKNKLNDKHYHDGKYWTYNSMKAFKEQFPYMSQSTIRNTLKKLENEELIVSGNFNVSQYDRTLWYSMTEKSICYFDKMHLLKLTNGSVKNNKSNCENQQTNTIYKPYNKPNNNIYKEYGEFQSVKLTDEQYNKLKLEYPNCYKELIQILDNYCSSSGKKYKNYYSAIKNWVIKRYEQENNKSKNENGNNQKSVDDEFPLLI